MISSKTTDVVKPMISSHRRQLTRPQPYIMKTKGALSSESLNVATTPNSGIKLPKIPGAPHESLLTASTKVSEFAPSQASNFTSPVSLTEKKDVPQHSKFRSFDDKPVSFLEKLKKS